MPPAVTDGQGRFEMRRLRRGRYDLYVEAPGDLGRGVAKEVETGSDVTIRLEALGTIAGSAPEASGACDVVIAGPTRRTIATAEPACAFRVGRLLPGEYTVRVSSNAGVGTASATVAAGETSEIVVHAQPWARLTGRVVERGSGRPMGGLRVAAVSQDEFSQDRLATYVLSGLMPVTADDGRFTIERVAPGAVELWVLGEAGIREPLLRHRIDAAPGTITDAGELAVNPSEPVR
ncbi:MAG: hypothetical protein D6689_04505 [Deltaproteobacteria bacterium]|nr:MAG: hypothetical protein D6689_04505 [Deltaproteobacteria bacterium]